MSTSATVLPSAFWTVLFFLSLATAIPVLVAPFIEIFALVPHAIKRWRRERRRPDLFRLVAVSIALLLMGLIMASDNKNVQFVSLMILAFFPVIYVVEAHLRRKEGRLGAIYWATLALFLASPFSAALYTSHLEAGTFFSTKTAAGAAGEPIAANCAQPVAWPDSVQGIDEALTGDDRSAKLCRLPNYYLFWLDQTGKGLFLDTFEVLEIDLSGLHAIQNPLISTIIVLYRAGVEFLAYSILFFQFRTWFQNRRTTERS